MYDRLDAVAGIKADALDRWIDEQSRNVVFVGVMPGVGDDARAFLDPETAGARTGAAPRSGCGHVLATFVAQTADAEEIYILDLDGTIRLSTLAAHEGAVRGDRAVLHDRVVAHDRAERLPLEPDRAADDHGRDAAVRPGRQGPAGRRRRGQPEPPAGRPDRRSSGPASARRAGPISSAGRCADPGHHGRAGGGGAPSAAIDAIAAQQSGRGLYTDADGTPVIGVYTWLPDREAGLIAEMSQDEAFGSARQLALAIGDRRSRLGGPAGGRHLVRRPARDPTDPVARRRPPARVRRGDLEATSGCARRTRSARSRPRSTT